MKSRLAAIFARERVKEALSVLTEFEFCYKMNKEESALYQDTGYMFPSYRPRGSFGINSDTKTIARRITSAKWIGEFYFTRFQVRTRDLHERGQFLYVNAFRLQKDSNIATIWFNSSQNVIEVVIQGLQVCLFI